MGQHADALAKVIECQLSHIPDVQIHQEIRTWVESIPTEPIVSCHYGDPPPDIVVGLLAMGIVDLTKADTAGLAANARSLGFAIKAIVGTYPSVNNISFWKALNWPAELLKLPAEQPKPPEALDMK